MGEGAFGIRRNDYHESGGSFGSTTWHFVPARNQGLGDRDSILGFREWGLGLKVLKV